MNRVAVVYNARSGALITSAGASPEQLLAELFSRHGATAALRPFDPQTYAADVDELLAGHPEALIVAGGDGTVRSIAERMLGSDIPLGVLPAGTMNVLARDLGVPHDLDDAVRALLAASILRIDVATVNSQPFLCSSTFAMMPHLGRLRERARGQAARETLRLAGRAVRLIWRYPRTRLTITVDGQEHAVRTSAAVVSCNPLAAGPSPMPGRDHLDTGRLAVYVTQDRSIWDLLAVTAKLLRGSWQRDARIRTYEGENVQVRSAKMSVMTVMSDGEISQLSMPLRYEIQPRALAVLAPGAAR